MDCKNIRKLIQNHIDGDAEAASFAEHLRTCPACRSYYEQLRRQQIMLQELAPERTPAFDLRAAQQQKRIRRTRIVRRVSAAAAVFVAVVITGSLLLFPQGKSAAPESDMAESESMLDMLFDDAVMEESVADAPAADAPAADAPAEDAPAEGVLDEPAAEAPDMECGAPLPPDGAEDDCSLSFSLTLPRDDFLNVQRILEENHFLLEPDENGFYLHHTDETTHALLTELLAPYTDQEIPADADLFFIGTE